MCSLGAQTVKNLSAVQEIQVRSLCQEDPLEEETATHSSILACGIPWATVHRSQRVGRDLVMKQQQNPRKGLKASFVPSLGCFISDLKCHRDYSGGFTPWEFLFRQINKKLVALKYVSSHWSPGQAARLPQPGRCGRFQQWLLRGRAGWPGWGAPQPQERLQSMKDDVVMRAKTSHPLFTPELSWQEKNKDAESICEKTWKQRSQSALCILRLHIHEFNQPWMEFTAGSISGCKTCTYRGQTVLCCFT